MRYGPEHKAEIHQKIVRDAARRVRAEGITGAAVSAVMRDAGLTHGGFYKHFGSKDELLMESLSEAFREIADRLAQAAEKSQPGTAMKAPIFGELTKYKSRMLPFMPGRRTADKESAFFSIFSTMIGAIEIARMLPEPAMRERVLASARDFLLRSF